MTLQELKSEALKKSEINKAIKEINKRESKNGKYNFTAKGYCPAEYLEDDYTGTGHYYTEWEELSAEELIDKLEDSNYYIISWDVYCSCCENIEWDCSCSLKCE